MCYMVYFVWHNTVWHRYRTYLHTSKQTKWHIAVELILHTKALNPWLPFRWCLAVIRCHSQSAVSEGHCCVWDRRRDLASMYSDKKTLLGWTISFTGLLFLAAILERLGHSNFAQKKHMHLPSCAFRIRFTYHHLLILFSCARQTHSRWILEALLLS